MKTISCLRIPNRHLAMLAVSLLIGGTSTPTSAALIAYEGFAYAPDSDLTGQEGGTGWTSPWGANSGGVSDPAGNVFGDTVKAGSLEYTDSKGNKLVTNGGHGHFSGAEGTSQPFRDFAGRGDSGTTTWISFVGVRQGETAANENPYPRGANLAFFNDGSERFAIGNASGSPTNAWSILNLGGSLANLRQSTRPYQQLTFVVVRVDHKDDNDDTYLFLNPALDTEPDIKTAAANTLGEFDHLFNRVRPFAGNFDAGNNRPFAQIALDEIRIGERFADVTPFVRGAGAPTISIALDAARAPVITYTGTLESAGAPSGPYQAVAGATSPHRPSVQPSTARFFRARN